MLMITGCASDVAIVSDPIPNFDNYDSWAFTPREEDQSFKYLDGGQVRKAIERELKRKAMSEEQPEEADLLVTWQIVEEEWLERTGLGLRFGYGRGLAEDPALVEVREVTLVVEFVDNDTRRVVWRAVSRRRNEIRPHESRRELIDEIVADMFKKYPPE